MRFSDSPPLPPDAGDDPSGRVSYRDMTPGRGGYGADSMSVQQLSLFPKSINILWFRNTEERCHLHRI